LSVAYQYPGIITPNTAAYGFASSRSAYNAPDPTRVKEQLLLLQTLWKTQGPKKFMYRNCWIQPKPPEKGERRNPPTDSKKWNRNLIPFLENRIQTDIEKNLGNRNICVKPRQGGYTTFFMIRRLFIPCILNPGHNGLLIAQKGKAVTDYFRILKRCYTSFGVVDPFDKSKNTFAKELHQHLLHTVYSNRRELVFDQIDVSIHCESAEVEEAGQGYSLAHVLADEVARWEHDPEATLANLKEAIPASGTLDLISTANGWGGYFFEECMRSRDKSRAYQEFVYHFHPWWFHDEYYDDIPADEDTLQKDELRLMVTYNLNTKQIAWRRRKKEELRTDFDEKYPEDDINCFLLTGQQFFDKDIIKERRMELTTYVPKWEGEKLIIYRNPKPHHEYIIGADVASGLDATEGKGDLDYSAAIVIDKATGEQVASYHAHIIPEEFGWELVELGKRYNNALIGVERNGDGGAVILTMEVACLYGNIYKHRDWWKKDWKKGKHTSGGSTGASTMREILGFPTNQKTRPIALNRLRHFIAESPDLLYDIKLIEECATFVRDFKKKGIPSASPGCHDDRVMSAAIGFYIRNVVLGYLSPEQLPRRESYGATPQEFASEEQVETDTEES
jgi:hypothetical protein